MPYPCSESVSSAASKVHLFKRVFTHLSTRLHIIAEHSRRRSVVVEALGSLLLLVVVDVDDVKGVDVAGDEAEDSQGDVDEEVCTATSDDVDAYWWYCWIVAS